MMAAVVHQLLAQLPAEPGDTAAEEGPRDRRRARLAEKSTAFAAQLIPAGTVRTPRARSTALPRSSWRRPTSSMTSRGY
ncbi:hypothetical protein [Streptomyces hydrogenans]|uniref:hypothetical protein n=1 Tax=Streptomyces hydrogenans TaxID=1873719 RepID=UPI001CFEC9D4|nr:hypothetical protein [Streptomyces hydrogenans]